MRHDVINKVKLVFITSLVLGVSAYAYVARFADRARSRTKWGCFDPSRDNGVLMAWHPRIDITGPAQRVVVTASDASGGVSCGRHLALRARPDVIGADGWIRPKAKVPQEPRPTTIVGDIIAKYAQTRGLDDYAAISGWIDERLTSARVPRVLVPYLHRAVENAVDAHDAAVEELGPLRFLDSHAAYGPPLSQVVVWAPLFTTGDGVREVRRYRLSHARAPEEELVMRWAAIAALAARSLIDDVPATRVRVIEVGLADGSTAVVIDEPVGQLGSLYDSHARGHVRALTEADDVSPGHGCGRCKAAGSCTALIPVAPVIGSTEMGRGTRSVSASDLRNYAECPAQWFLRSLHLPTDQRSSADTDRGKTVHRWLQLAHSREQACAAADLPEPGYGPYLGSGDISSEEYESAYPFLAQHIDVCPFSVASIELLSTEELLYSFDTDAQVVIATRTDMVYVDGGELVVREVKTSNARRSRNEAYDKYLQIQLSMTMLAGGMLTALAERYSQQMTSARVEVEYLTPETGDCWRWSLADRIATNVARADIARVAAAWHTDSEWITKPGPYCQVCPVSEWCPDSGVFAATRASTSGEEPSYE